MTKGGHKKRKALPTFSILNESGSLYITSHSRCAERSADFELPGSFGTNAVLLKGGLPKIRNAKARKTRLRRQRLSPFYGLRCWKLLFDGKIFQSFFHPFIGTAEVHG